MQDERHATVELVEATRLEQRGLSRLFGEIARKLAPDDAEQVEILPIELARHERPGEHDQADEPVEMQQRYRRPCPRVMQQPVGNMRQFALPIDPGARLVEIEDKFTCLQRLAEHCWRRLQRNVGPLPAPVRGQFELAFFIGHQK